MQDKEVTVIIPAFNEAGTIKDTIFAVRDISAVEQIIVIDDGSQDMTAKIASECGASVVSMPSNMGKGEALNYGRTFVNGKIVLLLDADLGQSASEAEKLLSPVMDGSADMTVAIFPPTGKRCGLGLVKKLAGIGIKYFTGLSLEAPLSGQRAMSREIFSEMLPLAGGFGVEVDLTVKAGKRGYRIIEVPVNMRHRVTGSDWRGIFHRGKQFWHVTKALLGHKKWCGNG